jgi:hypothetical protein
MGISHCLRKASLSVAGGACQLAVLRYLQEYMEIDLVCQFRIGDVLELKSSEKMNICVLSFGIPSYLCEFFHFAAVEKFDITPFHFN